MHVPHTVPFVQEDQLHTIALRIRAACSKVEAKVEEVGRTVSAARDGSSFATPDLWNSRFKNQCLLVKR